MRARTRHQRLCSIACQLYRALICLYPRDFRRAFDRELIITFRNQAEDVLDDGVLAWLTFAGRIAGDWVRTWGTLAIESETPSTGSLLGLHPRSGPAYGCIDRAPVDVSFVFAVA